MFKILNSIYWLQPSNLDAYRLAQNVYWNFDSLEVVNIFGV